MYPRTPSRLTRIGVFYDGNYFYKVSNYYKFAHERRARLSIKGLHEFIRHQVAALETVDVTLCQIVDAHFFRGRLSARIADERQHLYNDRVFDDILMGENVVTHYLPMRNDVEKGIDVWLALEAYELTLHKGFDVLVLITGDADFVPLARKINSLGARVMVVGWDFTYTDHHDQPQLTVTSSHLLDEVTYPVLMHHLIDDPSLKDDPLFLNLFVDARAYDPQWHAALPPQGEAEGSGDRHAGVVRALKDGYGFIGSQSYPDNIFFHWRSLIDCDFTRLAVDTPVTFQECVGPRGPFAVDVRVAEPAAENEPEEGGTPESPADDAPAPDSEVGPDEPPPEPGSDS